MTAARPTTSPSTAIRRRGPALGAAALSLVLVLGACSSDDDEGDEPTEQVDSDEATGGDEGAEVEADDVATEDEADPWTLNAGEFRGRNGDLIAYECSADGEPATVWGTDTYTDDSGVCTAAVHAGLIEFDDGGRVVIEIAEGEESYEGSEANGVTSQDYGEWGGSFTFVGD